MAHNGETKPPSWELEARNEAERLRQAINALAQLNRAFDEEGVSEAEFFETINHANDVALKSVEWVAD
jgi:hypothetical protein